MVTLPSGLTEIYPHVQHNATSYPRTSIQALPRRHYGSNNNMLDGGLTSLGEGWIYSLWAQTDAVGLEAQGQPAHALQRAGRAEAAAVPVAQGMCCRWLPSTDMTLTQRQDRSIQRVVRQPTQPNLGRLIAVRIAVLVRTSQYEKDEVTTENPRWANGAKAFDVKLPWTATGSIAASASMKP